jgi:signal transduction histidine kinase
MKNMNPGKGFEYLYFLGVVIFLIGLVATYGAYAETKSNEEQSLLVRTNTIAQFLDLSMIQSLQGTSTDATTQNYVALKQRFQSAEQVNPDARFVYLMGMRNHQIFFYLDSEPSSSPDMSPPGQLYTEAPKKIYDVFAAQRPMLSDPYTDRWGSWITALTPIIDSASGTTMAVVAMDISTSNETQKIIIACLPVVITTLGLLGLLIIYFFLRKKEMTQLSVRAELISMASHEIRSPLVGISAAASLLAEDKLLPEQSVIVQRIQNSSDKLLKTLNDFLDLYALQNPQRSFQPQSMDLTAAIQAVLPDFELAAKAQEVTITTTLIPQASIFGDDDKIRRMLNNLVSNAIKYSKKQGAVNILLEEKNGKYCLAIIDHGIGIPASEQGKVFQGFYRAGNARELVKNGTGLGLYYVMEVAGLHKATVRLESQEGVGTTFFIEFPKMAHGKI